MMNVFVIFARGDNTPDAIGSAVATSNTRLSIVKCVHPSTDWPFFSILSIPRELVCVKDDHHLSFLPSTQLFIVPFSRLLSFDIMCHVQVHTTAYYVSTIQDF